MVRSITAALLFRPPIYLCGQIGLTRKKLIIFELFSQREPSNLSLGTMIAT